MDMGIDHSRNQDSILGSILDIDVLVDPVGSIS